MLSTVPLCGHDQCRWYHWRRRGLRGVHCFPSLLLVSFVDYPFIILLFACTHAMHQNFLFLSFSFSLFLFLSLFISLSPNLPLCISFSLQIFLSTTSPRISHTFRPTRVKRTRAWTSTSLIVTAPSILPTCGATRASVSLLMMRSVTR